MFGLWIWDILFSFLYGIELDRGRALGVKGRVLCERQGSRIGTSLYHSISFFNAVGHATDTLAFRISQTPQTILRRHVMFKPRRPITSMHSPLHFYSNTIIITENSPSKSPVSVSRDRESSVRTGRSPTRTCSRPPPLYQSLPLRTEVSLSHFQNTKEST